MSNGQTIDLEGILVKDSIACELSNLNTEWEMRRAQWVADKAEIQKYVWATDTRSTTNAKLQWKNSTTIPKLCQIRDNLFANYLAALFPKRKWLTWEADNSGDQDREKAEVIEAYMENVVDRPEFKAEIAKMLYDYIDYGNTFATPEWVDQTLLLPETEKEKAGYVGPLPKRISPLDIIFNPSADSFYRTGKFIRTLYTFGDFASMLEAETAPDLVEEYKILLDYMTNLRLKIGQTNSTYTMKNDIMQVAGFGNFLDYLRSNYVEVLTFYGDFYDMANKKLYKNKIITIVDRHKLINIRDNPSLLGDDGIYHCGWRIRQDVLWAMGPLDNLVGMQYRIDHLENLKADVFDLIAAPPLKIKGLVDDFSWGPFSRIHVGEDGDVEVMAPEVNALTANMEIQQILNTMEEMAGSPKEAMGFRTPGEKTMYEVQRLENAASRIFATKIKQFEEQILEPLLNAMLAMAVRKLDAASIRIFDNSLNVAVFKDITKDDLSGSGRIRPMAARHFAERAELVQNLNAFFSSALGADPDIKLHFSSEKLAAMFEDMLDIEAYEVVQPYIRISEQQHAQQLMNASAESVQMNAMAPSGLTPDDTTEGNPFLGQ